MRSKPISDAEWQAQLSAREAEAQRRIQAAQITFGPCADIPGVNVARWTDSRGDSRILFYYAQHIEDFGWWNVQISDYQNGSFGSSTATSRVSAEDAVANWIASWW